MDTATRERFDAQLAAFLTAVDYVRAVTQNVTYGVPVPHDVKTAWEHARGEHEFQVRAWRQEGGRR
jgi:hypothetical protein